MKNSIFLFLIAFIFVLSSLAIQSCKRPRKLVLTKDQKVRIDENILKEAPKNIKQIEANLENAIKLLGVNASAEVVKPGETITINYFWQCLKELKGEWKIFVHLELPGPRRIILDHNPVGELYPIEQWKIGEIIKDEQRVVIPDDIPEGEGVFWVGVFNEETYREQGGGDRLILLNKDTVPNDGENRIKALTFRVEKEKSAETSKRETQKPLLRSLKTIGEIKVDGILNEPVWQLCIPSDPFLRPDGQPLNEEYETRVRSSYDNEFLYLAFDVKDDDIFNSKTSRDAPLWEEDAIEIFLDPEGDGLNYIEIQLSPANIVFDALFKEHRTPDWKTAKLFNFKKLLTGVSVNGSLNKKDDGVVDKSWSVEVGIPFSEIPGVKKFPPDIGEKWRVNFYRIDNKGPTSLEYQGAFSPVGGDFHALKEAGEILFTPTLSDLVRTIPPAVNIPAKIQTGMEIKTLTPKREKKKE